MLNLAPSTKVYFCNQPVDMRKQFDGLSGLVQTHFGKNPLCGHMFVFFSKRKDRMKVLTWQLDGFALYYKRLERGTFSWVEDIAAGGEISADDFSLLLSGLNPVTGQRKNVYQPALETGTISNCQANQL